MRRLTKDLTLRDYAFISQLPLLLENVNTVGPVNGEVIAEHPSEGQLPWAVVLLLGAYSKKHVFAPKATTRKETHERCLDFENRVKWAVALKDAPDRHNKPLLKHRVWPCKAQMPPVVNSFIRAVRELVLNKVEAATRFRVRAPSFVRYSTKWLKSNGLKAIVSDKDGVFALVPAVVELAGAT